MKFVLFLLILSANLLFFSYWTALMFLELRNQIRTKFKNIYLIVCLCGRSEKLEMEI